MSTGGCGIITDNGHFYDITHTFKIGSSVYHILGLRKDRPNYKNTYYIFDCPKDHQHSFRHRSLSNSSYGQSLTEKLDGITKTVSRPATSHRARQTSPKKDEINVAAIKETCTSAMKTERQLFVNSLRKEMNVKKKVILRAMKKDKEAILKVTSEANDKEQIIRLLEEQKDMLKKAFEDFITTTSASIEDLRRRLTDSLDANHNASQSIQQLQLTLVQTIEEEVQKLKLKNEEILKVSSNEINTINKLEKTFIHKMEDFSARTNNFDETTLQNLFAGQNKTLITAITQQQQPTISLELIKQTVVDAIKEHQTISGNTIYSMGNSHQFPDDNAVSTQNLPGKCSDTTQHNTSSLPTIRLDKNSYKPNQVMRNLDYRKSADRHLFKVSVRSPESAHLYAKLIVDGIEYSERLYTMCQRDLLQSDVYNCYVSPPSQKDGFYDITIYAKTNQETKYRAAISIRFPGSKISSSVTFPLLHQAFDQHQCILIEPLQRHMRQNEQVLIHMIVPGATSVKIRNGDDNFELSANEYKDDVVKKKLRIRGDVHIVGCWEEKIDSTICVFNMIH